jgi:Protein of unknown function (DUF1549)/Protein of unknown function (DUF1553)
MKSHPLLAVGILSLAFAQGVGAADRDVTALAAKIDERVAASWARDVKPAPLADDAEFFRRVHLDLAGRIPSVTEARDFLDDDRPDKRRLWVDRILRADPDDPSYRTAYVNHFTNVWRAWLLARTDQQGQFRQPALETWLRKRLKANTSYDRLVRELLTQPLGGNGDSAVGEGSAAVFFQANELKPENLAGSTARLFLGVTIECAQCHNHPFDKWTRQQFWEYAGFFTDVVPQAKPGARGEIKAPGQDKVIPARFLDGREPNWKDGNGTRPTLAEWMTARDNPYFARAAVNRLWAYLFGTELAESTDRPGDERPAAPKGLLDELAREFTAHDYDMKYLIRAITASQAYQRTSAVSHPSHKDSRLFARMPLRGLSPEQLFDSLAEATEYQDGAPGNSQSARGQFLARFPAQDQKIDYQTSILQALYLMNNDFIADRTSLEMNRTLATLAEQRTSTARKVESLYLVVLSRKPRPQESERFVKYVEKDGSGADAKKALADVFWVLLNSPEFILNH